MPEVASLEDSEEGALLDDSSAFDDSEEMDEESIDVSSELISDVVFSEEVGASSDDDVPSEDEPRGSM